MGSWCTTSQEKGVSAFKSYNKRQRELSISRGLSSGDAGSSSVVLNSNEVGSPLSLQSYGNRQISANKNEDLTSERETYSWKLASIEEIIKAYERKEEFCNKTIIEAPNLLNRLSELECSGKIVLEEGTNFGMVVLGEKWQELQEELLEVLSREKEAYRPEFISQASGKASEWGNLLGLAKNQTGFFCPVSAAGLHISLGKINEENKPDCVVEGGEVRFLIKGCTTMPSLFSLPKIYPCQRTTVVGDTALMNFPTRWYFLSIEVEDFNFPFKYPPHITLGCYGLMNVPQAAVKEMYRSLEKAGAGSSNYEYGKSS